MPSPETLADVPEWLHAAATAYSEPTSGPSGTTEPRPRRGDEVKAALALVHGGTSRHAAILKLTHWAYSNGRDIKDAAALCQEFSSKMGKGWTKDDEDAVRRAYKWRDEQKSNPKGQPRPQAATAATASSKDWRDLVRHTTLGELLDNPPPPLKAIIPDFLLEGYTLLGGRPKEGKSWLAMHLALAVAAGGTALKTLPCHQGRALYLSLETGEGLMYERLEKMGVDKPENLEFWWDCPPLDKGGLGALNSYLDEFSDTSLVVLDTFAMLKPTPKTGNVFDADYAAHSELLKLAKERHIAVLALIHTGKDASRTSIVDKIMGTTGVTAPPDSIYGFESGQDERDDAGRVVKTARLELKTRLMESATYGLRRLNDVECVWAISGDGSDIAPPVDAQSLTKGQRLVVEQVNAHGVTTSDTLCKMVMDATGMSRSASIRMIQRLAQDGLVARHGKGKYGPRVASSDDDGDTPREGTEGTDAAPASPASQSDDCDALGGLEDAYAGDPVPQHTQYAGLGGDCVTASDDSYAVASGSYPPLSFCRDVAMSHAGQPGHRDITTTRQEREEVSQLPCRNGKVDEEEEDESVASSCDDDSADTDARVLLWAKLFKCPLPQQGTDAERAAVIRRVEVYWDDCDESTAQRIVSAYDRARRLPVSHDAALNAALDSVGSAIREDMREAVKS